MNTKNRLLAGASALALIVGTSACDARDNDEENTVVVVNEDEANIIDRDEATNDLR